MEILFNLIFGFLVIVFMAVTLCLSLLHASYEVGGEFIIEGFSGRRARFFERVSDGWSRL